MERRAELVSGLGASILGLICVVLEAQAFASPFSNPALSWLLGINRSSGIGDAIVSTQHALLPMAVVFGALALGAYLHVVHRRAAGLALLISSSAVVILVAGFMVFNSTYVELLFLPAPLVVFTTVLAAGASVCAISSLRPGPSLRRLVPIRLGGSRGVRSHEAL